MIEHVDLENFQCHRQLRVVLGPGVTSIVGASDVGKSAIARAIRWVVFNRPQGAACIRSGASGARCCLSFDGGHNVERGRGSGGNTYSFDGGTHTAFGSDVPDSIRAVLNLDAVNFQGQHDPPWWFMLSPGEVSRELNKIVNLDLIDSALASLASQLRAVRAEVEVVKERLAEAEAKRDGLAWVAEADGELSYVEALEEKLRERRAEAQGLRELIDEAEKVEEIALANAELKPLADRAVEVGAEALELRGRRYLLNCLVNDAREGEDALCRAKVSRDAAVKELEEALRGTCPICNRPLPRR